MLPTIEDFEFERFNPNDQDPKTYSQAQKELVYNFTLNIRQICPLKEAALKNINSLDFGKAAKVDWDDQSFLVKRLSHNIITFI